MAKIVSGKGTCAMAPSPTGEQDATLPAALECADHLFREAPFIGSPHAAKANIHWRRPGLEKSLQIGGRLKGSVGVEEPIACDMAKGGPVRWARQHMRAKPVEVRRLLPSHLRKRRAQGRAQNSMDGFAHGPSV